MSSRDRLRVCQLIHRRIVALADTYDLTLAAADMDHIAPRFLTACQRMQDARPGLPGAASYDGPAVSGSGTDRLTHPERLACQPDRTQADRERLDELLHSLERITRPNDGVIVDQSKHAAAITAGVLSLRKLIDAWTPRTPNARDLRIVQVANSAPVDCEHHATAGIFEPVHRTGNAGGNLDLPTRLCLACYNYVRRNGKLPSGEWMERRRRTGKDDKERVS